MKRILVVDDDADIRDLAQFKLRQSGFEVHTASDGEAGLNAALELVPDAVLLDVSMPKLTGLDVCRSLREHDETAQIPIMLLTARAQETDVKAGFLNGADDYIVKPFSTRELVSRLKSLLARTALQAVSPRNTSRMALGRILVERGVCTMEQFHAAAEQQLQTGEPLAKILVDLGISSAHEVMGAISELPSIQYVDFDETPVEEEIGQAVPEALARRHKVVPVRTLEDESIALAMAQPSDIIALEDLREKTGLRFTPMIAGEDEINEQLDALWQRTQEESVAEEEEARFVTEARQDVEAPAVRVVDELLHRAIEARASDLHLEPVGDRLRIRLRVDGALREEQPIPSDLQSAVISRLKLLGEMNIAEHRVPQDGRSTVEHAGRLIDLRLVTLPTVFGEAVVIRLLDRTAAVRSIADLGLSDDTLDQYLEAVREPHGAILVTGPTGSGKSTTLYAALRELNDATRTIVTVEDPVEYRLPGVKQLLLNSKAGITIASALRSILRSDPEVILVGEIRDLETARIASEAALTGHKVLSSLHANSAAATPARLLDMGLEPYLVVSSLRCALGQRLLRTLCRCRESLRPTALELTNAGWTDAVDAAVSAMGGEPQFARPVGCDLCGGTGYRGRLAVVEALPISPAIGAAILERRPAEDLQEIAIGEGMVTMNVDGLRRAASGSTSLEEVVRVVPAE